MDNKRYCPKCGKEMKVIEVGTYNVYTGEPQKAYKCEEHGVQYIN